MEEFKKDGKWDMIAIQAECKKRYPIGCTYKDGNHQVLRQDDFTYRIVDISIWSHSQGGVLFSDGKWSDVISLPETKVEDKPMKELTELPEKWCIKLTKENQQIVGKYYNRKGAIAYTDADRIGKYLSSHNLSSGISVMSETENHGSNFCMTTCESYTEITFDQFKKWVLKENESDVSAYVECIKASGRFTKGKIYKLENGSTDNSLQIISDDGSQQSGQGYPMSGSVWKFKPSTKEAYDAQFPTKITSVDKWSVGTYVVFIKTVSPLRTLGFIDKITDSYSNSVNLEKSANCVMQRETDGEIMWFATKQEAEDFAKTLIIENTYEFTSKHVLLEQAKKRYPVGTVIDSLGGMPNEIISTNDPYFVSDDNIRFNNDQLVYSNGEWAKIISKPTSISSSFNMQEILEEAKRRFPIGSKIKCLAEDGKVTHTVKNFNHDTQTKNEIWFISTKDLGLKVYHDGEWTKIVSLPEEKVSPVNTQVFEVGDTVRIVKKFQKDLFNWTSPMNNFIGTEGVINDIGSINGACMIKNWWYLPESLELVKRKDWERLPEPLDVTPIIGRNTSIYTCDAITAWNAIPSKVSKNEPMRLKRLGTTTI
jgi:hypothetical protein